MREINCLTPKQETHLDKETQYWLANGRSVEPLDRRRATEAICALYAARGLSTPTVLCFSSPAMCIQALHAMVGFPTKRHRQRDTQLETQLREQLKSSANPKRWQWLQRRVAPSTRIRIQSQRPSALWSQTWDQLSTHAESRIDSRIGPSLWVKLECDLRSDLWEQLRSRIWRPLNGKLHAQARESKTQISDAESPRHASRYGEDPRDLRWRLHDIRYEEAHLERVKIDISMPGLEMHPRGSNTDIWEHCMGAWWCASAVLYEFCADLGISYTLDQRRLLRLWLDQCRHSHWWFDCDGIVFLSNRPKALNLDSSGRLHNERGAALDYGDGFRLCSIHGVHVEENDVLHPERITLGRIEREPNVEVRRVLTSFYGQARYLKDSGATLVHQDERGKLWRKMRNRDTDLVMVEVENSTQEPNGTSRSYLLRVPPDMKTAAEAVAWTFSMHSDQYSPSIET